jgi:hypothetical protein
MSQGARSDVKEMVEGLAALVQAALREKTPESFETLEQQAGRFEGFIREVQQAQTSADAKKAVHRLQKGEPLSAEEQATLRALVVGDAEYYLRHENNLADWLAELERLTGEIQRLSGSEDEESLANLRGVVRDAVRLLPSIRAYMEEKRRLERFNSAMARLDADNRSLLVQLIKEMLESPTR